MKLIIEDDEGRKTVVPMVREEITIGRQEGNTIRLTERNVSRRHARLVKDNGSVLIEDLGSYNGVRVNGEKIAGPTKIKEGDLVEIGDYDLGIQGKLDDKPAPPPTVSAPKMATIPPGSMKAPAAARPATVPPQQAAPPPPPPPPQPAAAPQESSPAAAPQASMPSAMAGGATAIIRVSDIMKQAPQVEARDLAKNEMPRLVGISGPARGKELILMKSEVKFGRTDDNDISFDHQSVSRQHARFVLDQGQWKVIDNKSANGVRVNGEEYAVSNLKPGDNLELGHLKFRFCAPGEKYTPPADTSGEHGSVKGGLKPTTAELIAGASQPGRGIPGQAKAAPARSGPPMAIIGGAIGLVVVIGVVLFLVMGRGKKGEEGGEAGEGVSGSAALKAGDAAFKKKDFIKANELYEKAEASGEKAPNKKRAAEEAKAEEQYKEMKSAVDSGDGDKAKIIFEKCAAESTFYCQKAQEMADPVKASYARKHLAIANAAKTSGKNDVAQTEAGNVLAFDPGNAEAQALVASLTPAEKPEAPKKEGPSPKEREAKAAKLAADCNSHLKPGELPTAVKFGQQAVALNPTDKNTLSSSYRCLGYAYANLQDRASAVKWLEKYLPYCTNDCPQIRTFLGK